MKIHPLILPKKLLIALSGISLAMIIGTFYNAYNNADTGITWLLAAILMNFVAFAAVIVDLVRNPVKNKIVWVILLFLFSFLASFFYLVMRDSLLENEE